MTIIEEIILSLVITFIVFGWYALLLNKIIPYIYNIKRLEKKMKSKWEKYKLYVLNVEEDCLAEDTIIKRISSLYSIPSSSMTWRTSAASLTASSSV